MVMFLVLLAFAAAGAVLGWRARSLVAERDEWRREEQRDAEWDAAHGVRRSEP
jgi:hypothetical protein